MSGFLVYVIISMQVGMSGFGTYLPDVFEI